ncbi:hypothetical protein [Actinacidiphila glaucinigra]|uniref:hypothetical protein n=1 Tax=Actinacidiphila glaucinigra TaxID=235986 RepID=UPI0036E606D2
MTSTALSRLTGPHRRLTLGLELPLDNDWGTGRLAADRQAGPAAAAEPIRLGPRTGRTALLGHLAAMADLGVAHVSLNLRPGDRPVAEVLHELAEEVLLHFPGR